LSICCCCCSLVVHEVARCIIKNVLIKAFKILAW
jgi:hypothetical protein